jgi:hypothetical protein
MKTLEQLIGQIITAPETVEFLDVINVIDANYHYTPVHFSNGPADDCVINEAGKNEGSCKIFSFAQIQHLDAIQTLNCFGHYYRDEVLNHPHNFDHANIRNFMRYGWKTINFEHSALEENIRKNHVERSSIDITKK